MEYVVRENETIFDIANKSGVSASEIASVNYLDESSPIRSGDKLEIPTAKDLEKNFPKLGFRNPLRGSIRPIDPVGEMKGRDPSMQGPPRQRPGSVGGLINEVVSPSKEIGPARIYARPNPRRLLEEAKGQFDTGRVNPSRPYWGPRPEMPVNPSGIMDIGASVDIGPVTLRAGIDPGRGASSRSQSPKQYFPPGSLSATYRFNEGGPVDSSLPRRRVPMKRFQMGGQVERTPPAQGPAPQSQKQKLPIMGSPIQDSGIRKQSLVQAKPPMKMSQAPGGPQAQKKSFGNIRKNFGRPTGPGMMKPHRPGAGSAKMIKPQPRPGGPGMPPMGPGSPKGGPQKQPVGGPGSQWMDGFLRKRQFQGGGSVGRPAPGAQSGAAQAYGQAMQKIRSQGLRGGAQQPRFQMGSPQGMPGGPRGPAGPRFSQGGMVGPPDIVPHQAPHGEGLDEFRNRQQSLLPINPHPQGELGVGPHNDQAEGLASFGRGGDSMLMHVNKDEVNQMATSINPKTGLPEALPFLAALPAIMSVVTAVGGLVGSFVGGGKEEKGGGQMAGAPAPVQKGEYRSPEDPMDKRREQGAPNPRPNESARLPSGEVAGRMKMPTQETQAPVGAPAAQPQELDVQEPKESGIPSLSRMTNMPPSIDPRQNMKKKKPTAYYRGGLAGIQGEATPPSGFLPTVHHAIRNRQPS